MLAWFESGVASLHIASTHDRKSRDFHTCSHKPKTRTHVNHHDTCVGVKAYRQLRRALSHARCVATMYATLLYPTTSLVPSSSILLDGNVSTSATNSTREPCVRPGQSGARLDSCVDRGAVKAEGGDNSSCLKSLWSKFALCIYTDLGREMMNCTT